MFRTAMIWFPLATAANEVANRNTHAAAGSETGAAAASWGRKVKRATRALGPPFSRRFRAYEKG